MNKRTDQEIAEWQAEQEHRKNFHELMRGLYGPDTDARCHAHAAKARRLNAQRLTLAVAAIFAFLLLGAAILVANAAITEREFPISKQDLNP